MPDKPPIGVIGVGWVGLVSAACFAELGHHVWCRDIDAAKVDSLRGGHVPIYEPDLAELVTRNAERLHFELDVAPLMEHARLLFVCVDTPPTYSGDADLSRVESVIEELPASAEHAIVMKSTVPVGTGTNVQRRLGELGKGELGYASNPEFLKEGSAVVDFMQPDRVVVGADARTPWAADAVAQLYEPLDCPVVRTDVASAEMIKLASNAFLATKISFINEIANVCEEVGADVGEVASGMGLDPRIGRSFLNAGVGFGGSCLLGEETVMVRRGGQIRMMRLDQLFEELITLKGEDAEAGFLLPDGLDVLSWGPGDDRPEYLPVSVATRRPYSGEVLEVRTKMGRRLRCTPDHPFVAREHGETVVTKQAHELSEADWLPVAQGIASGTPSPGDPLELLDGADVLGLTENEVIVRARRGDVMAVGSRPVDERNTVLDHPRGSRVRLYDIGRSGAMRLDELRQLGLSATSTALGTARNGTYVPSGLEPDRAFWRVVGLYLAEGHCTVDGSRCRLAWSFHPTNEPDLVDEVASYWKQLGVKATVRRGTTSMSVTVSSRILGAFWLDVLGLGPDCYSHRIPDLVWNQPEEHKRALLAGLWRGDGSWSYLAGGPSVVLEWGTVSRDLADGVLRLLGELGFVARLKVGRTAKSTCDTYWVVVSGADQIERLLELVPAADRHSISSSVGRQQKRIAATGYRKDSDGTAWVRVVEKRPLRHDGYVYSLEVPGSETFVTTGGLVVHNCFPKDVSALKQLAGNSGYHFQLLTAVIEVNELQKRRVVSKLKKHLGSLVGKEVALLGLAFKPHTDDMREASSVVLASRLQGEGAVVRAYDPVAEERAGQMLTGVAMCDSALDAVAGADAAVIVTEWPEFADLDLGEVSKRMANPVIVDGRNMLDAEAVRGAGFVYEGIGRL
jgi:UDPglucose 6-dehydrogenase